VARGVRDLYVIAGIHAQAVRRDGAGTSLAWLAHPISLGALVVLIVNDHVLKAAFPGVVTGKVSDVAGLVVAPPFLASMVLLAVGRLSPGRVAVGSISVVGIGFTLAKATGAGASVAGAAWSLLMPHAVVVADATDLFALPALGAAWYAWRRARGRALRDRTVRLVRVCVVLPATFLALSATSPAWAPAAVDVVEVDGQIVLGVASVTDSRQPGQLDHANVSASSADGLTWSRPTYGPTTPDLSGHEPTPMSCRPTDPRDCYRVVPGRLAVERGNDNDGWDVAWQVSVRDLARLRSHYESFTRDLLACRSILVHETGRGYVVVAACGRDGFVMRDTAGVWQRIGFPPDPVTDLAAIRSPNVIEPLPLGAGLLAAWGALAIASELVVRRHPNRISTKVLAGLSIAGLLLVLIMIHNEPLLGWLFLLAGAPVQFGLLIAWLLLHIQQRSLRARVVAAATATGLVTSLLPYLAHFGYLPNYSWIYPAAIALGMAGIAATAVLARRTGRANDPPPVKREVPAPAGPPT